VSERELANSGERALLRLYDTALPHVYGYLLLPKRNRTA